MTARPARRSRWTCYAGRPGSGRASPSPGSSSSSSASSSARRRASDRTPRPGSAAAMRSPRRRRLPALRGTYRGRPSPSIRSRCDERVATTDGRATDRRRVHGERSVGSVAAVEERGRPAPEGDDEKLRRARRRRGGPGRSVVDGAGPADEADVDVAHRVGEPVDRVVAEAQEVGRDLEVAEPARPRRDPPTPRSRLRRARRAAARARRRAGLLLGQREVVPDAADEVVHVRLPVGRMTMSIEADGPRPDQ